MGNAAGGMGTTRWVQLTEPFLHSYFSQRSKAYSLPPPEPPGPSLIKHWGMRGYAHALSRPFFCGPLQIQAALAFPGVCAPPPPELLFKSAQGPGQVASERT